ncbi:MAG TPA: ATP-binding cassette domain-containing protein [Bacteroidetes bacterium]|nr:ATP-binding cassette domain-containing protein [Bacteroidota bacterium]
MNIEIKNVNKFYGYQKVLDDVSFEVKPGEILGFLGPNGAGKTTTMKIITGYIGMDSGDVVIDGQSVKTGETKSSIGYLPENNPLYLDMSVVDYLRFSAKLQGVEKGNIENKVREMIKLTGLNKEKHKLIGELSKGYRQRVGLAQALIHDPEILILDEPTTGLDPNQIIEIRELIKELGKEKTVILSTHILPEVEATCDRILIINKGKIVANGTSKNLRQQAEGNNLLKIKLKVPENDTVLEKIRELPSVEEVSLVNDETGRFDIKSYKGLRSNRDIFDLCAKNNWPIIEMIPIETKLEDVFRDLTMN